jgi:glycosyltransferase involved in cell wall biosynthesis
MPPFGYSSFGKNEWSSNRHAQQIMAALSPELNTVPGVLTLLAAGLLVYTYAGYPALLWLIAKWKRPVKTVSDEPSRWPSVTVIISAHNEEAVIARRIHNLLDQEYPPGRLEILIGSDGSTDATCKVVARYQYAGVHLAAFPARRGKASVLNDLVARASGELVVFTDAATVFYPDALKELVAGFRRYPSASVIVGQLEMRSSASSRNLDGLYWRYELFLKRLESMIGAGLGASGTIYAIRRRDYCPLPSDTIADDLLEPLLIRRHTKGDVVLHADARAWQLIPAKVEDEFHRRVRSGGGIAHVLRETWRLLLPQWGVVALALWSHKVLRLLGPWILLMAMAGNIWMLNHWAYRILFMMQAALYGLGLSAGRLRAVPVVGKMALAIRYFFVLNAALAVGSLKFMFGMAGPTWNRTARPLDHAAAYPELEPQKAAQEQRPAA